MLRPLMFSGKVPTLLRITFCPDDVVLINCGIGNDSVVRERFPCAAEPDPASDTLGTAGFESLARESVPLRCPKAVGVNVTWTKQLAFAASVAGQLFVCEKSPLIVKPLRFNGSPPKLVKVRFCA